MIKRFEYIRLRLDFGDLAELNSLGSTGWHVVAVVPGHEESFVLLEREYLRPFDVWAQSK